MGILSVFSSLCFQSTRVKNKRSSGEYDNTPTPVNTTPEFTIKGKESTIYIRHAVANCPYKVSSQKE